MKNLTHFEKIILENICFDDYSFNGKKQKRLIESQDMKTLLDNLNNQFYKLEHKLFCKVNTQENILKLIQLILIEVKQRLKPYKSKEKKALDKYDVPFKKWSDISDELIGAKFVFPTENWTISYGDHWENDHFMVTLDLAPFYLETDSTIIISEVKTLSRAKNIAHKYIKDKLK